MFLTGLSSIFEKLIWKDFSGLFFFMDIKKISQIKPLFKYNSKVNSESADILANYFASSFQGYKCYGTLHARGNTKKDTITKPQNPFNFLTQVTVMALIKEARTHILRLVIEH
jgi:hypothetical protein